MFDYITNKPTFQLELKRSPLQRECQVSNLSLLAVVVFD